MTLFKWLEKIVGSGKMWIENLTVDSEFKSKYFVFNLLDKEE